MLHRTTGSVLRDSSAVPEQLSRDTAATPDCGATGFRDGSQECGLTGK